MGGDGAPGRCRIEGCTSPALVYQRPTRYVDLCGSHRAQQERRVPSWRDRTAPLAEEVDWTSLSPEGRETLRTVAVLIMAGVQTHAEIGAALRMTSDEVSRRMKELREEIRAQAERDGDRASAG